MTPSREADIKSTTRGNWKAVISRNMRIPERRCFILACVGKLLRYELGVYCSDNCQSVLLSQNLDDIKAFKWESLVSEMEDKMPCLFKLLKKCTDLPINTEKTSNSQSRMMVGLVLSIMAKQRRPQACLLQKIVALLLYSGHCSKKVCMSFVTFPQYCL